MLLSFPARQHLLPHEEVSAEHLQELLEQLRRDRILRRAIIADTQSKVILDGHHRWHAAKRLGLKRIPVFFVDLWSEDIIVEPFRSDIPVSKKLVIERGTSGTLLPWKTTRHVFGCRRIPIAEAFPPVHIPLPSLL